MHSYSNMASQGSRRVWNGAVRLVQQIHTSGRIGSQIRTYKCKISAYSPTGKFTTDVLWNLGSLAVLGVSGVVINSIIAHYQSAASLGVFNQAFAFYIVLSQLAVGGMQFSIVKYLSHTDDPDLMATVVSSAIMAIAVTAGLVAIVAFWVAHYIGIAFESQDVTLGIQFICPSLVIFSINKAFMVLTDDPTLAEKARSLRNLCFHGSRRFHHTQLGFNFRLTNLQAAIGVAQLERIAGIVERKRWMGREYNGRLGGIKTLQLPVEQSCGS